MCGISGFVFKNTHYIHKYKKFVNASINNMKHRGPDDNNIWASKNILLGHVRLSIIDLTKSSSQPFHDKRYNLTISYNGEIYNYLELREKLQKKGYFFKTSGDTEVILLGYHCYKEKILDLIEGMFSFAIWDENKKKIFCARDHTGQKPFFYYFDNNKFIFLSELDKFVHYKCLNLSLNFTSIKKYLISGYFQHPYTPFKDIFKLNPGSYLTLDLKDFKIKKKNYFKYSIKKSNQKKNKFKKPELLLNEYEKCIISSVEKHLRSDAPIGSFLSAGIDSSTIAAIATKKLNYKIKTFTIKIKSRNKSYDESLIAKKTSKILGTDHHEEEIKESQILDKIENALNFLDEPIVDYGYFANFVASEFASKHVKAILNGAGGDELFYGYEPFMKFKYSNYIDYIPKPLVKALSFFLKDGKSTDQYMSFTEKFNIFIKSHKIKNCFKNSLWIGAFTLNDLKNLKLTKDNTYERLLTNFKKYYKKNRDDLDNLGIEYFNTYLPGIICSHGDKATMAHSLEGRNPFLDKSVINFASQIPSDYKVKNGSGKWIMREYLKKNFSELNLHNVKKKGYTLPIANWLQNELKDFMKSLITSENLNLIGIKNVTLVNKLVDDHLSNHRNNGKMLWSLVVIIFWLKKINSNKSLF